MVKHIVLWKIRNDDQKQANIDQMISMLTSLVGKIEGLVSMEMGYNFNTNSEYDVVLYATFKNAAALKYYQDHPEHLKCKEFVHSVAVDRTAADYFSEEGVKTSRPFDEVPDAPVKEEMINAPTTPPAQPVSPMPVAPPVPPVPPMPVAPPVPVTPSAPPVPPTPVAPPVPPMPVTPPAPPTPPTPVPPVTSKPSEPEEPAPMKFEDIPPAPMKFDDIPPAPMKFDDIPPAPMKFDDVPPPAPMKFSDDKPERKQEERAPFFSRNSMRESEPEPAPAPKPAPTPKPAPAPKPAHAPKPAPAPAPVKAESNGNNWTCPNCGKVMPKYVGTCGCGTPQPFSFDDDPPALQPDPHDAAAVKAAGSAYPDMKAKASKMSASAPKKESSGLFGSKKTEPAKTSASAPPPAAAGANTWTCPACGKVMPNYVGTCGCGEPKPFAFDDLPPALQADPHDAEAVKAAGSAYPDMKAKASKMSSSAPRNTAPSKPAPSPSAPPPAAAGANTWTCPACGKVMPNYVGTCGCGEPKPFAFDDLPPALQADPHDSEAMRAAGSAYPDMKAKASKMSSSAPRNTAPSKPAPSPSAPPPAAAGANTWTCPACGKVMPNYVGTCGCGEPKPFAFDDLPPALQADPHDAEAMRAAGSAYPDMKAKAESMSSSRQAPSAANEELPTGFRSRRRKNNADPAPPANKNDKWTCPQCGKVLPKYITSCGCGASQPFDFNDGLPIGNSSAPKSYGMPAVGKDNSSDEDNRIIDDSEFNSAAPSLQSYNPQGDNNTDDQDSAEDAKMPFGSNPSGMPAFGFDDDPAPAPMRFDDAPPPAPMRFDDAQPPAPMRFDDAPPPAPMRFDDAPPPAPMRFDDAPPPAPMRFDDAPPPAPMRFDDAPPPAPMKFNSNTPPAPSAAPKAEKKHLFGKKAKEAEVMRQAEAAVQNRKDVPGAGSTWTCPACGKVMPKYVGTCGCGESQPFDF